MLSALIFSVFRALTFWSEPAQAVVPVRIKRRSQQSKQRFSNDR